ncbi:MAG: RsmB/NOP family class I SAM-dependent RNA methyltransferase [Flavimaricola sp.]|nr:RsmB/NOP family class I SAM-dependent RNA methyltransferase [Flavimaricola sp.]
MTPGARIAAAIEVLDAMLAGLPPEKALTNWGRASRFAGSKDRLAVRDHVYDGWRCQRSCAALGGSHTGRGIMIGALRHAGVDPATLMTGDGHAPQPPGPLDQGIRVEELPDPVRYDMPDWLADRLLTDLGPRATEAMTALQSRAPVFLRVNGRKSDPAGAIVALAHDGIEAVAVPDVPGALEVIENARKIKASAPYLKGMVELQDASSQAAVLTLPLHSGDRVLDYCAGGGGKSLAMAARADVVVTAHDAEPRRMADLSARALRGGHRIAQARTEDLEMLPPFDLVLVDAPCSGSGTWRRDPAGKWALSPGRLADLTALQAEILRRAAELVRPGGVLGYMTCSILAAENGQQIVAFLNEHGAWREDSQKAWLPGPQGDGFFVATLRAPD